MSATAEAGLFEGQEYEVPFPQVDGKEVTDLVLRLGGSLMLNRNDPAHAALIESLTLGKYVTLEVSASVDGKGQNIRTDDEKETVTHHVALKLHAVELA
jgi:hypothetical protein